MASDPAAPPRAGRVRVPSPLISYRLPSGRGATEQPNATGDGEAALTPRFWAMVALTGVAAGLLGDLMMAILFTVQHLAFGYHIGTLESGVGHASDTRRLVVLLIAGAFGGISWFLLRRYTRGEKSELDDVVWVTVPGCPSAGRSVPRSSPRSSLAWVRRSAGRTRPS